MKRNDFIRNCLLGLAATILPEILRPSDSEIKTEKDLPTYLSNFGMMIPLGAHKYYYIDADFNIHESSEGIGCTIKYTENKIQVHETTRQ